MKPTTPLVHRRAALMGLAVVLLPGHALAAKDKPRIPVEVWKDPQCGCCGDWIAHLEANGFKVTTHETGNAAARSRFQIAAKYGSCHTARVGGYAIEGHVPAREIHRLLAEKPNAIGLAVPGMPIGSPGMDGPAYGGKQQAYEVLLLARDGSSSVFQRYPGRSA